MIAEVRMDKIPYATAFLICESYVGLQAPLCGRVLASSVIMLTPYPLKSVVHSVVGSPPH